MKFITIALVTGIFSAGVNALDEEQSYFDEFGINTNLNNQSVMIPNSPFDYHPVSEGESFNMITVGAKIRTTEACGVLGFDTVVQNLQNDMQNTYKYIEKNWESMLISWAVFSQPQLAAVWENLNADISLDLDMSLATCSGIRTAAKSKNTKEWKAYKDQQACMEKNGGMQMECLSEYDSTTDRFNSTILKARASVNDWVADNSNGKVEKKSGTENNSVDQLDITCGVADISSNVCTSIKKLMPKMITEGNDDGPSFVKADQSIPEFIGDLKSEIKSEITKYLNETDPNKRKAHNAKLYNLSFGSANMTPYQSKQLLEVYKQRKPFVFDAYVDRLSSLWAYRGTRRLFAKAKYGIEDGQAKSDLDQPSSNQTKLKSMLVAREDYLKSIEEDYKISMMEEKIWESLEKLQN